MPMIEALDTLLKVNHLLKLGLVFNEFLNWSDKYIFVVEVEEKWEPNEVKTTDFAHGKLYLHQWVKVFGELSILKVGVVHSLFHAVAKLHLVIPSEQQLQ